MKMSLLGAGFVLGVALSSAAMAAEATDADAKSGATDSTVLTQAQDAKAAKKQKAETTKGGRPLTGSSEDRAEDLQLTGKTRSKSGREQAPSHRVFHRP